MNSAKQSNIAFQPHAHQHCRRQLLAQADDLCKQRKIRLTARRRQVLEVLLGSHQPMGAYEILAELNRVEESGTVAPPIVYRALDFLISEGLIHRIESRNAFISCSLPGHQTIAQFLICRNCEQVAELHDRSRDLMTSAESLGFAVDHTVIEITGLCAECQQGRR